MNNKLLVKRTWPYVGDGVQLAAVYEHEHTLVFAFQKICTDDRWHYVCVEHDKNSNHEMKYDWIHAHEIIDNLHNGKIDPGCTFKIPKGKA